MERKRKKGSIASEDESIFDPKPRGNFVVVKTSLKSILREYETNVAIINKLVLECNEIVTRTYQFMRLFILSKYHKKEPLPKLDKNTILYFIGAGGDKGKQGKKLRLEFEAELDEFYVKEYQPLINKPKFDLKKKNIYHKIFSYSNTNSI